MARVLRQVASLQLIIHIVELIKTGLISYLRIFADLIRVRLNIATNSTLKPTKVGFIFSGPNFVSQAEDLSAVNHVTQDVVRVSRLRLSLKPGLNELRLEPKLFNRRLWEIIKFEFVSKI